MVTKTKVIRRIIRQKNSNDFTQLLGKSVALGFRGPSKHMGIDNRANLTNTELSYILETGDPAHNMPPRPFLLPAYIAVEAKKRLIKVAYQGDNVLLKINTTAKVLAEEMKDYVRRGQVEPPIKPQTIQRRAEKARQFNKTLASEDYPLYETGELIEYLEGWLVRKV